MKVEVEILKEAKKNLLDYGSWCPRGLSDVVNGKIRCCFIHTLGNARRQVGGASASTDFKLVRTAAYDLLGNVDLAEYNDGDFKWKEVPNRERWKTLHKILDRAIEMAESETKS